MVSAYFVYYKDKGICYLLSKEIDGYYVLHNFDDTVVGLNEFLFNLCNKNKYIFLWENWCIKTRPNESYPLPANYRRWLMEIWDFEDYYDGRWGYLVPGESEDEGVFI